MQDFDEEIRKIKEKRSKMEMSEEGKEKIRKIIEARNARLDDNDVVTYIPKRKKTYIFAQKIAAVFVCCLVLSSCAFAGEWKDLLTKIFYGEGANIEYAVDNGYVQNIDMDYVESNGIKIKVDYFYSDDYYMYIAFDVVAEEEFEDCLFYEIEILNNENNLIFSNIKFVNKIFYELETKRMSKNSAMIIGKFSKIQDKFYNYDCVKININNIQLGKNNENIDIIGNWNLVTELSNNIIIDEVEQKYYITGNYLFEKCEVRLKNKILNVNIKFKEGCIENLCFDKNNIYLRDNTDKIYYMNEDSKFKSDMLIANFYIEKDNNIDNFKLNIKYNDEVIVFYLKEIDS